MPPSPDIPSLPDSVPGRTGMIESFDLAKDMMGWQVGVPDSTTRAGWLWPDR